MSSTNRRYKPNCLLPKGESLPEGVKRVAAAVEYDGSFFCGWQIQSHSPSVQQEVNQALSKIANEPVLTACAGRTDSGVHATNQIIHFDTRADRKPHNWIKGVNTYLPDAVRIHQVSEVDGHFHARFSASSRTYRYVIYNADVRPAILASKVSWVRQPLDEVKMHQAVQLLMGKHDFSSFRAVGCQSHTAVRSVLSTKVWRQGKLIIFEISANAFLYHMVRNITGALIKVGSNQLSMDQFQAIFEGKDRTKAPATAAPFGLYLVDVGYSAENQRLFRQQPSFLSAIEPGPEFVLELSD